MISLTREQAEFVASALHEKRVGHYNFATPHDRKEAETCSQIASEIERQLDESCDEPKAYADMNEAELVESLRNQMDYWLAARGREKL